MFYQFLYPLHEQITALNIFRYITFRTIYGGLTAFLICFLFGPWVIRRLQKMQIGQDKFAMQTLNQSLFLLAHDRQITQDDAMARSHDIDELKQMFANPAAALGRKKAINPGRGR